MEINYFFRAKNKAFSIENVFNTIEAATSKTILRRKIYMPKADASPLSLLKNIIFTYRGRSKKGVNHITGDIHYCMIGLIGCISVLTIHDLVFIRNAKNPIDKFFKWLLWIYIPVKLADKVVCISENTKQELARYINIKKVIVIYNPINELFKFDDKPFNTPPIVLHIGTGWNKNLERVIEAISGCGFHLRIIGKINDSQRQLLEQLNVIYYNSYLLTDEEIAAEYSKCDIVSFPSLYEGFGMPIIEGQATGRVVLTSRLPPMTEIGVNSVHYVDPLDWQSIKSGLIKLVNDIEYRQKLISEGFINVERFNPVHISNQYLELYNSLFK